jgi:DNA anti-recombination protein RmuC
MAQTGCGTACADELLERVRVRAIEKHYLVRNARLQRILAAPSETALEVSAAVRSVLRKLASWEAARIRRRASKLTSLNASDSLEAEFEQLAAELYRADVQRRTMAETVQETLAALTRDMQTRRLASYLLEETTQEAIAALEGTHQATVSRQLRNLKRRLEHALGAEIQP